MSEVEMLKRKIRNLKGRMADVLTTINVLAEENGIDNGNARGIISMLAASVIERELKIEEEEKAR